MVCAGSCYRRSAELPIRSANMDDEPQLLAVDEPTRRAEDSSARWWWLALLALVAANVIGVVLIAGLRF
jgi:hypothetical protein